MEASEDRALAVRVALSDPASDARLSRTPQVGRIADDRHGLLVRLDLVGHSAVAGDRLVHEAQVVLDGGIVECVGHQKPRRAARNAGVVGPEGVVHTKFGDGVRPGLLLQPDQSGEEGPGAMAGSTTVTSSLP
ncbi:hypothetical protein AB0P32_07030 [Streptomyces sp. NPDC085995]|uniref:hypothetical protein n=1 Tax=Streptomyces sp. NPDC085995 TaxID=3154861 RepID=UPI00341FF4B6